MARLSGIFADKPPFEAVPFMRHDGRADAFRGLADDPVLAGGPVPLGARVRRVMAKPPSNAATATTAPAT